MTLREQLLDEIRQLPEQKVADVLHWVRQLRQQERFDWDAWWISFGAISDDFMSDRNQPSLPQQPLYLHHQTTPRIGFATLSCNESERFRIIDRFGLQSWNTAWRKVRIHHLTEIGWIIFVGHFKSLA